MRCSPGLGIGYAGWSRCAGPPPSQDAAWQAQQALDRFAREMADIGVTVRPRLPHVDTRWFADFFFDNIITDAIRHQRIARTYDETAKIDRWCRPTSSNSTVPS